MAIRINGVDTPSTVNTKSDMAHGTYHLADNPNLYEIQRSANFEFVITGLDNILRPGMLGDEDNARIANAQEVIRMSVVSCPIPHFTQSVIEVRRGNNVVKFAGAMTFPEGTITVHDWIGADTKSALMAWQNLSGNVETEKVGLASDYKKTCYLIEYTPDWQVVRRFVVQGCWISGISEDDHNNENDDKHQIRATIQYDKAKLDTTEIV